MNDRFQDQLAQFIVVLSVDILIYRHTLDKHVHFILQTLHDKLFYAKISKCEFLKKSITYPGHLIIE